MENGNCSNKEDENTPLEPSTKRPLGDEVGLGGGALDQSESPVAKKQRPSVASPPQPSTSEPAPEDDEDEVNNYELVDDDDEDEEFVDEDEEEDEEEEDDDDDVEVIEVEDEDEDEDDDVVVLDPDSSRSSLRGASMRDVVPELLVGVELLMRQLPKDLPRGLRKDYSKDGVQICTKPFPVVGIKDLMAVENAQKIAHSIKNIEMKKATDDLYSYQHSRFDLVSYHGLAMIRDFFLNQVRPMAEDLLDMKLSHRDLAINVSKYGQHDYLNCHDDQDTFREVAFIWYLTEDWNINDGGLLELFTCGKNGPEEVTRRLVPQFNQLIMFHVSTTSYHQVSEVLAKKHRWSINGWFYDVQHSREPIPRLYHLNWAGPFYQCKANRGPSLEKWIKPIYLSNRERTTCYQMFLKMSEVQMDMFLRDEKRQEVHEALRECDRQNLWKEFYAPIFARYKYLDWQGPDRKQLPKVLVDMMRMFTSAEFIHWVYTVTGLKFLPEDYSIYDSEDDDIQVVGVGQLKARSLPKSKWRAEIRRWDHGCYKMINDADPELREAASLDLSIHFTDYKELNKDDDLMDDAVWDHQIMMEQQLKEEEAGVKRKVEEEEDVRKCLMEREMASVSSSSNGGTSANKPPILINLDDDDDDDDDNDDDDDDDDEIQEIRPQRVDPKPTVVQLDDDDSEVVILEQAATKKVNARRPKVAKVRPHSHDVDDNAPEQHEESTYNELDEEEEDDGDEPVEEEVDKAEWDEEEEEELVGNKPPVPSYDSSKGGYLSYVCWSGGRPSTNELLGLLPFSSCLQMVYRLRNTVSHVKYISKGCDHVPYYQIAITFSHASPTSKSKKSRKKTSEVSNNNNTTTTANNNNNNSKKNQKNQNKANSNKEPKASASKDALEKAGSGSGGDENGLEEKEEEELRKEAKEAIPVLTLDD